MDCSKLNRQMAIFFSGEDFDMRIVNYLADEFKKKMVSTSLKINGLQRLKEAAEKAKIELSSSSQTETTSHLMMDDLLANRHGDKPTRAKLESLVNDLIKASLKTLSGSFERRSAYH